MPSGISLMIPATQLQRTSSPSSGFAENFQSSFIAFSLLIRSNKPWEKSPGKITQGPLRAILKNFVRLKCEALCDRVRNLWVRDTTSLKASAKLAPWRRHEHHKPHSLLLQVYSSISLNSEIEQGENSLSAENPTNAADSTAKERRGNSCAQWRARCKNQHKLGTVHKWKWSCCAQGLSANIASQGRYTHTPLLRYRTECRVCAVCEVPELH